MVYILWGCPKALEILDMQNVWHKTLHKVKALRGRGRKVGGGFSVWSASSWVTTRPWLSLIIPPNTTLGHPLQDIHQTCSPAPGLLQQLFLPVPCLSFKFSCSCHFILQIKFYWQTVTLIQLYILQGCFWATRAEGSSQERDWLVCKAENIYFLALFLQKSLLTAALSQTPGLFFS